MQVAVHTLDDGAWISVNDARRVSVSDLWLLARHDVCACEVADFLAEGFVDVGVADGDIAAKIAGRCIVCGEESVTDWVTVGRVIDGTFYGVVPESIHIPRLRHRGTSA
ncbi:MULTISPECIES: hypothetical protein [unclassified Haladaptatus]|uniref:hypothetical protein n=1 Tax=unclassified Haladaptatus TaxID=2622732 RepID=UPI0023E7EFA3|nr:MULTISPECIES: hypothetical protein [unclassified Haladaptatus]